MRFEKRFIIVTCAIALVSFGAQAGGGKTVLGIDGDYFTINGETQFLLGISAMDGIGQLDDDQFDWLKAHGFDLIRVWAHWAQNILEGHAPTVDKLDRENVLWDPDGAIRPEKLKELRTLLERADERGMIVDITVFHTMYCFPGDSDLEWRSRALRELSDGIKDYRNVIYDLTNEYEFGVSHPDLRTLRDVVKRADYSRICTASTIRAAGNTDYAKILPGLKNGIVFTGFDVLTPHLARSKDFAARTDERVREIKASFRADGIIVPLYLQEEARRRHSGLNPEVDEFLLAARSAKANGAAAWTFHTDAGYNLDAGPIYECMDEVEKEVAEKLAPMLAEVPLPEMAQEKRRATAK